MPWNFSWKWLIMKVTWKKMIKVLLRKKNFSRIETLKKKFKEKINKKTVGNPEDISFRISSSVHRLSWLSIPVTYWRTYLWYIMIIMKLKQKNYHAILVMIEKYVDFAEKEFKKQNKQTKMSKPNWNLKQNNA